MEEHGEVRKLPWLFLVAKRKACEMSGNVPFGYIYCQQIFIDGSEILLLNNMGHYVFHGIFKYNVNVKHLLVVIHPYHQTKWGVSEALDTSGPVSIAVYSEHLNFLWPWNVNCLTLRFWFANIVGITDIVG